MTGHWLSLAKNDTKNFYSTLWKLRIQRNCVDYTSDWPLPLHVI